MANARILQQAKSSMQSGKHNVDQWVLDFEPQLAKKPDPLTGWAGSGDPISDQVRLRFPTKEAAIAYAEREGLTYHVQEAPKKLLKLQSYADNFR